jgi:hypothetical protein
LLAALIEDRSLKIDGMVYQAADLIAAAIQGAGARPGPNERNILTVRDNGTFTDEVQQRLIYALGSRGLNVTLLWRSVATILGLEGDLNPLAPRLDGKRIGVVSLLADGIDISVLNLESRRDSAGPYLVPVREKQGFFVPYTASIFACAETYALALAGGDADIAHQLLWGGGAAIGAYLMGRAGVTLVQDRGKWRLLDISDMKQGAQLPTLEGGAVEVAKRCLNGIEFVVFEGPASDARSTNLRMAYQLRDLLIADGVNVLKYGWIRETEGLVAKGAVRYARREGADRRTYYDYLPAIRFAAMTDDGPAFIDLVPPTERLEGGQAYGPKTFELGLWLEPATTKLTNYLVKELSPEPRVSRIELRARPARRIPINVEIYQKPLAGLARIYLKSASSEEFSPIELDWGRMEIDGRSEAEILASILPASQAIPPIQPAQCHAALWTQGSRSYPSLVELLKQWDDRSQPTSTSDEFFEWVDAIYSRLNRSDTLYRMTGGENPDKTPFRAISGLGEVPAPIDGLNAADIRRFDDLMNLLAKAIDDPRNVPKAREKWALTCAWAFSRCPEKLVRMLARGILDDADPMFNARTSFSGLGRVLVSAPDIRALFRGVENIKSPKIYHFRAVTALLSRIEIAANAITPTFAETMANAALKQISTAPRRKPTSTWTPAAIQLVAALLRGRIIAPTLLDPDSSKLARDIVKGLDVLEATPKTTPRISAMSRSVIDWMEKKGTDSGVLSQDVPGDDTDADGDED